MAHLAFVAHLTARILVSHLVKEIGWRQIVKQSAFLAQVLLRTYVFKESSSFYPFDNDISHEIMIFNIYS